MTTMYHVVQREGRWLAGSDDEYCRPSARVQSDRQLIIWLSAHLLAIGTHLTTSTSQPSDSPRFRLLFFVLRGFFALLCTCAS